MKALHKITFLLVIIGGINWLLVGLFGWDLGNLFGGQSALVSRAVYVLIGLSAICEIIIHKQICRVCGASVGA